MSMYKRSVLMIIGIGLILLLAACQSDTTNKTSQSTPVVKKTATVTSQPTPQPTAQGTSSQGSSTGGSGQSGLVESGSQPGVTLTAMPASVPAGGNITINGSVGDLWPAGTQITVSVVQGNQPPVVSGNTTLDATKKFSLSLTIDPKVAPGTYDLYAYPAGVSGGMGALAAHHALTVTLH